MSTFNAIYKGKVGEVKGSLKKDKFRVSGFFSGHSNSSDTASGANTGNIRIISTSFFIMLTSGDLTTLYENVAAGKQIGDIEIILNQNVDGEEKPNLKMKLVGCVGHYAKFMSPPTAISVLSDISGYLVSCLNVMRAGKRKFFNYLEEKIEEFDISSDKEIEDTTQEYLFIAVVPQKIHIDYSSYDANKPKGQYASMIEHGQ